jgi:CheY-like chemotaxis protein
MASSSGSRPKRGENPVPRRFISAKFVELGALFVVSLGCVGGVWCLSNDAAGRDQYANVDLFAARDQGGFPLSSSSKSPLTGQRILVAEDESFIALELERMLESFGCAVVGPVSSVTEVLQYAAKGSLDGALLDVNLRGQQIFEILPKLETLGLRLIMTSGYNDATLFPAAFRRVPRIAKPFDETELRRICENVFAKSASRSQSEAY